MGAPRGLYSWVALVVCAPFLSCLLVEGAKTRHSGEGTLSPNQTETGARQERYIKGHGQSLLSFHTAEGITRDMTHDAAVSRYLMGSLSPFPEPPTHSDSPEQGKTEPQEQKQMPKEAETERTGQPEEKEKGKGKEEAALQTRLSRPSFNPFRTRELEKIQDPYEPSQHTFTPEEMAEIRRGLDSVPTAGIITGTVLFILAVIAVFLVHKYHPLYPSGTCCVCLPLRIGTVFITCLLLIVGVQHFFKAPLTYHVPMGVLIVIFSSIGLYGALRADSLSLKIFYFYEILHGVVAVTAPILIEAVVAKLIQEGLESEGEEKQMLYSMAAPLAHLGFLYIILHGVFMCFIVLPILCYCLWTVGSLIEALKAGGSGDECVNALLLKADSDLDDINKEGEGEATEAGELERGEPAGAGGEGDPSGPN
uniref:Cytochrome b561 domain-containing protein n=1 Tax=Chromera velia CCMP2878 TaxID=1169474 RepID=A0A0G4FNM2_9ALVE|eukprot:Cvel_17767.t1-p1 / transcript=Cvel_17767.t1 / gene=Cvel_17767 / organism=Chromera_velia_CCMP2878 / gene_product=hypothetical protein / transcript_product=hypothetical protein / location=Cvel_scaffold1436:33550-37503(-) / protein_length=421 / sequence_SO=supercontig / SO=protein_coding / is_pseudo=false